MEEKFNAIRKYNFWDEKTPELGFYRADYVDKIYTYTGNRLIKVLIGQRRTGKSYILRQLANKLIDNGIHKENILYINKEYTDFDFISNYSDLDNFVKFYKKQLNVSGKIYLFIDEIQNIVGWEHFVNSCSQDFVDEHEIFISGSNSRMLSGELATLLSGRYVEFEIFPFSFSEYSGILQKENTKQNFIEYMESGGLPELFNLQNIEIKRNYVSAIKDTVFLRDIIQRYNIKEPKLLEDIFVFLVNNAANLVSITNLVDYFKSLGRKTTYDTVSTYIGYMEDSFLVHKSERYDIRGKNTISGNAKYYINDLAYKNYLYTGFGYGIGYQLENLVYLNLKRAGFKVYTGVFRNKEVDFVALKNDRILYVQASYLMIDENTIEREYSPLESIPDNYEKVVVSLDDICFPQKNGIKHEQIWKFNP
ncbi:MAG: ATP-binding protein [Dysgonamonadaceae bacterium]|jgi:predicted AAA+ superfamily ATPase|nr:ATP-binding protein [Dysgonamonadaceae bacterium]